MLEAWGAFLVELLWPPQWYQTRAGWRVCAILTIMLDLAILYILFLGMSQP